MGSGLFASSQFFIFFVFQDAPRKGILFIFKMRLVRKISSSFKMRLAVGGLLLQ